MPKTALVAIGGNSLIRAGEKGTVAEQLANARQTANAIVGLIQTGYKECSRTATDRRLGHSCCDRSARRTRFLDNRWMYAALRARAK